MNYKEFVQASSNHGVDTNEIRQKLIEVFEDIHIKVKCLHCQSDPLHIAHELLTNQQLTGPVLEFGCYKGGMTCKLSHVVSLLGRKLHVFDSFTGLIETVKYKTFPDVPAELGEFEKGQFACPLEEVQTNVLKFGKIDYCKFHQGIIQETLSHFKENPSLVFIDVDSVSTAQYIIRQLWNRIENTKVFTHEGCIQEYMNNMKNSVWWNAYLKTERPQTGSEVLQRPFGLPNSNCLDYFIKKDCVADREPKV
jgi:hypothetical protein